MAFWQRVASGAWRRVRGRPRIGRRGAVAIIFAACAIPICMAIGASVEMMQIISGRAALQRAADNAALSGAAAYVLYTQGDTYNAVALNAASSAFCNMAVALPAGYVMAGTGGRACPAGPGAAVSATIAGFKTGTLGVVLNSGCSATRTVVAGVTCGFVVTVSASATIKLPFPLLGLAQQTVFVTASAVNPFINLASAISASLLGSANYANSLWVYPLLLDGNGSPDFITNNGALPDFSACTGNPSQLSCGSYTMLASTVTGVVQNPTTGNAVITSTTPLGFAFESTGGGFSSYGYNGKTAPDGCTWPNTLVYNTVTQVFDANNQPQLPWSLPTHWFYSSFLANTMAPSQLEIATQTNTNINPATGVAYAMQDIPPVTQVVSGVNNPATCSNATSPSNRERMATTYPVAGATNCSLYIVRDPTSNLPNPAYKNNNVCFTPSATPGKQYAALSCQSFAGHTFAFFWNDMGGRWSDDTDYGNGTLIVSCSGPTAVTLIN